MFTRRIAAAAVVALLLAGCAGGTPSGGQFEGTQWVLSSYLENGSLAIVPETIFADATFESSFVSGQSGCNSYRALYQAGGRSLRISQSTGTLMACDQPTMDFETTFKTLLASSRYYTARDDTMTIYDDSRTPVLVFDAAPRNPLLGRWDVSSFLLPPSTVTSPLEGTKLEVVFGIASVGGSSGCNTFSGTYGTNGTTVRISPLATTRIACDQPVMDQETAFLAALQGVARIDYRGSQVNLTDRQGHLVVGLTRPVPEPSPSAGPSASAKASAAPEASTSAKPSATPTAKPTASPTPTPSPTKSPTPAPSATPVASASAPPQPSASIPVVPVTATCDLAPTDGGATVAKLVYPGTWHTVTEPANLACRYFDPAEITVPADPATLQTAVTATVLATPYADAVTAATDPANWTVVRSGTSTATGISITCVDATALTDAAGIPVGSSSHACLVDVGTSGTVVLRTVGATVDEAFATNAAVVSLMTLVSSYIPTS
jgi:heat shock protein HslJ